jgi:4-hydroxybenzoate polyprenyltransferase
VGEFCIALGFCLRVVAGILAIGSKRSPWIVLATFFLALFIAFGKRQSERAARHLASPRDPNPGRASLKEYTVGSLDLFLIGSGCLSILTYALFAILSAPTPDLILTVPFVVYGIFRYLSLVRNGPLGESPERLVLQDRALFLNSLLWLSTYLALAKMRVGFFER